MHDPRDCIVINTDVETRVKYFFSRCTITHFLLGPPGLTIGGIMQVQHWLNITQQV